MKIVVGTDDGKKLSREHFGMSKVFVIYTVLNGEIKHVEKMENPIVAEHKHAEADDILKLLGDADIFIGRSMGRKSVEQLIENGITPYLTTLDDADEAVSRLINGEMDYFMEFDREQKKFISYKRKKEEGR